MSEQLKKVTIYTDGSCIGNPGKGGWGAVLMYGDKVKKMKGRDDETTNNKMELKAVIEALRALKESCEIDLYTDSHYVKHGINEWIKKWKLNNWRTANRQQVKNVELWQELDKEVARHKISWHWVKGHSGDKWNEIADQLARGEEV